MKADNYVESSLSSLPPHSMVGVSAPVVSFMAMDAGSPRLPDMCADESTRWRRHRSS